MEENNIFQKQNTPLFIERLQAQGRIYDEAKDYSYWVVALSIIFVLLFAVLKILFPNVEWLITISITYGVFSSVLCLVLEWQRKKKKNLAACIQQQIDCELFDIPWWPNWGNKPALEEIQETASKEKPDRYYNWYDVAIQSVSKQAAVLICFRCNVMYDSRLRTKYIWACHITFALAALIMIVICMLFKLSFPDFVCYVLAPAMPVILMYIKTVLAEKTDTNNLKSIRSNLEQMKNRILSGDTITSQDKQLVQDSILSFRKSSFSIPSFFYYKYRSNNEESMHQFASRMAEELAGH